MALKGKSLCFTGILEMKRAEAKSLAEEAGATVTGSVSKKTNILVAGSGAGSKISDAQAKGVEVWTEDEFKDAINGKGKKRKKAAAPKKAAAAEPPKPPKPAKKAKGLPPPNPAIGEIAEISGLQGQGSIFANGSDVYDIDVAFRDASVNSNKFYKMQIIALNDGTFTFVQHWGRIGTKGQCKLTNYSDANEAMKDMEAKFKQKAGILFADRNSGVSGGSSKYQILNQRLDNAKAGRGEVAVSLMWDNRSQSKRNDLDLHVLCPSGQEIYFMNKKSDCGGELDVDRMQDCSEPVENIVWKKTAPKGKYSVYVNNFSSSHNGAMPYTAMVVVKGESEMIEGVTSTNPEEKKQLIKTFTV
jgi:predicted DNA-binding WGR domain protein